MSRIGQKPIEIPDGTEVKIQENFIKVKGPKGEIEKKFLPEETDIQVEDGQITVRPKKKERLSKALWGTYASHIKNMIQGVNDLYEKRLVVEGIGFKVSVQGNNLVLSLGFSHDVEMEIPEGLDVSVEKNTISIKGVNKELVGQFASKIKSKKKPEPYKGKGIRYEGEVIRRKQGKKAV